MDHRHHKESLLIYYKKDDAYSDLLRSLEPVMKNDTGLQAQDAYHIAQLHIMLAVAQCKERGILHAMLEYLAIEWPDEYTPAIVSATHAQIDECENFI